MTQAIALSRFALQKAQPREEQQSPERAHQFEVTKEGFILCAKCIQGQQGILWINRLHVASVSLHQILLAAGGCSPGHCKLGCPPWKIKSKKLHPSAIIAAACKTSSSSAHATAHQLMPHATKEHQAHATCHVNHACQKIDTL